MKFELRENRYLVCSLLEKIGFTHAFGTRHGTLSYLSPPQTLHQIHSDQIHFFDKKITEKIEGDALATNKPELMVGVRTADCLPILLGDPESKISAAIHAGWRGTVNRITEKTILKLKDLYNINLKKTRVALGPAACEKCYEIGPEVIAEVREKLDKGNSLLIPSKEGHAYFNSIKANILQLEKSGIDPENIFTDSLCTMHQNELFFSHRIEGKTNPRTVGRMLSLIGQYAGGQNRR